MGCLKGALCTMDYAVVCDHCSPFSCRKRISLVEVAGGFIPRNHQMAPPGASKRIHLQQIVEAFNSERRLWYHPAHVHNVASTNERTARRKNEMCSLKPNTSLVATRPSIHRTAQRAHCPHRGCRLGCPMKRGSILWSMLGRGCSVVRYHVRQPRRNAYLVDNSPIGRLLQDALLFLRRLKNNLILDAWLFLRRPNTNLLLDAWLFVALGGLYYQTTCPINA